METKSLSIYDYSDFRKFLNDYQRERYKTDKQFSRVQLCRKLGIPKSRSFFSDVINGKKVTDTFIERFIEAFELKRSEALYFRILVNYNQATNADERNVYFEQLIAANKSPQTILSPEVYDYFGQWYHSVIRALLDVVDVKDNFDEIASMLVPVITENKVRQSISMMKKLGLITCNENGVYKPVNKNISTGTFVQDELIKSYQRQCLKLAEDALSRKQVYPQTMVTKMISVSLPAYKAIEQRLQRFLQEISTIVHKDDKPADRVYHLDIQLFPGCIVNKSVSPEDEGQNQ
jgi:uncharacterized protein (TIGR02147 family)